MITHLPASFTSLFAYLKSCKARLTRDWRAPKDPNAIEFGAIDPADGTFYPGYVTRGGEMRYEKRGIPDDEWSKPKAISTWKGTSRIEYRDHIQIVPDSGVVYRQTRRAGSEVRMFTGSPTKPEYIDVEAYDKADRMVWL